MPAVPVPDVTTLPRVPEPAPDAAPRRATSVTTAPAGHDGAGFPVRRASDGGAA